MKHIKCAITIAATLAMLIGTQSFTQCRGDDSGTQSGTLLMNADSPTCLPTSDDYTGTTTINAGTLILGSALVTTSSEPLIIGTGTLRNNAFQATMVSGATLDVNSGTALVKVGTGTTTISGNNTYNGAITFSSGTLQLGNSTALGRASAPLIIADGATLDLNIRQLYAKPITVQGTGVVGNGAIVNNSATNPAGTQYNVSNLTLSGNTTIGGTFSAASNPGLPGSQYQGRWSLRAQTGMATLSTSGHAYTLTKTGNNQIMLVSTNVDSALGNVSVNEGVLSLEGTTVLSNPATTATVNVATLSPSAGSILQMRSLTAPLTKNITLSNNGQLTYLQNSAGTDGASAGTIRLTSNNSFTGTTTINNGTLLVNSSGLGAVQLGTGTVTLDGNVTYTGTPIINAGTLQLNNTSSGTLNIGNIISGTMDISVAQPSTVNLIAAPITINQSGTLQVANNTNLTLSGSTLALNSYSGLTKIGAGTLTLSNNATYVGSTTVINGSTLQVATSLTPSETSSVTMNIASIYSIPSISALSIDSIAVGTPLTIVSGSNVRSVSLNAIGTGTLLTSDPAETVPEPSVMVLLSIAFLAFLRFGLRPKNSAVRP